MVATPDTTDIHGTDQGQLLTVGGAARVPGQPGTILVYLSFTPTDEQMATLLEHLRSWHP